MIRIPFRSMAITRFWWLRIRRSSPCRVVREMRSTAVNAAAGERIGGDGHTKRTYTDSVPKTGRSLLEIPKCSAGREVDGIVAGLAHSVKRNAWDPIIILSPAQRYA